THNLGSARPRSSCSLSDFLVSSPFPSCSLQNQPRESAAHGHKFCAISLLAYHPPRTTALLPVRSPWIFLRRDRFVRLCALLHPSSNSPSCRTRRHNKGRFGFSDSLPVGSTLLPHRPER